MREHMLKTHHQTRVPIAVKAEDCMHNTDHCLQLEELNHQDPTHLINTLHLDVKLAVQQLKLLQL